MNQEPQERQGDEQVDGEQLTVHERLTELRSAVAGGKYGTVDDLDISALREDLVDVTYDMSD